jgi:hypothetical protein
MPSRPVCPLWLRWYSARAETRTLARCLAVSILEPCRLASALAPVSLTLLHSNASIAVEFDLEVQQRCFAKDRQHCKSEG